MDKCVYKNAKLNNKVTDITVENGIIKSICKTNEDGIDLKGNFVFAGLLDIHSHGIGGYDTMEGNLAEMTVLQAKNGITSWLPTTMTMDMDSIKKAVNVVIPKGQGANILGFHLEGPYISVKYKGAQNEKFIKNPDLDEFKSLNNIKLITIAPELDGSIDFIKNCGTIVSLGHTDCGFETAIKGIEAGAKCLTHTFNAMPPLHHRKPSVIGAAIEKNIYVQVICDGTHLHKSIVLALYKIFGAERMILISDSLRATGLCDGEYNFGGQVISVKDSVARTEDGTIAGSTTTLFDCVKKAIEFGIPELDAFKMASKTPADLLGISKGRVEEGYDADFIVADENFNLLNTVISGEIFNR